MTVLIIPITLIFTCIFRNRKHHQNPVCVRTFNISKADRISLLSQFYHVVPLLVLVRLNFTILCSLTGVIQMEYLWKILFDKESVGFFFN